MKDRIKSVLNAAIDWWEMSRPCGWSVGLHLQNPEINCVGDAEHCLARAVAAILLEAKKELKDGKRATSGVGIRE